MSRLRLTATVASVVAAWSLVAAPATADSRSDRDPTGDVSTTRLRGGHPALDITRSEYTFAYGRLTLSTSVASTADTRPLVVWKVSGGGTTSFGTVALRRGEVRAGFGKPDGSSCASAVGSVDGDTVTLVVPVACLAGATAVRIGGYTIQRRGHHRFLVDDAHQGRIRHQAWPVLTRRLAYSP